ncbi:MAG: sigma-54 dependent transcriptional regulator [Gammaproteobacteria bacterium]|nr:sigma-54 dependent transcriptional regulator [Gammaproteobacteria bacterium]
MDDNQASARLLIVDDEVVAVKNLAYALSKSGYEVITRTSGPGGLEALESTQFDVVLTDLRMEHVDGMAILDKAKALDSDVAVIMITGHANFNSAVDAMKAGAFHYVAKPFRLDEVREIVARAVELVQTKRQNRTLQFLVDQEMSGPKFITQDAAIQRLLKNVGQIAPTECSVLISGESGTGKELVARYLHQHSRRADKPFVAINCGAFQDELLANELFGHEKGAFTGAHEARAGLIESADGGTLFLDEIGDMSLPMQVKLLRVIQEQEVQRLGATVTRKIDVRYLAATNRDLQADISQGHFRQDLFYRLNVVSFNLPPLSERRDDIPLLAYYFLKKHALHMDRPVSDISHDALEKLTAYDFPGNVRELENLIERGIAMATGSELGIEQLPKNITDKGLRVIRPRSDKLQSLDEREEEYIRWILKETSWNRTQTADILGIARASLWRKLKKYGLDDS